MLFAFGDKKPRIAENAFIAQTACLIGDVTIGEKTSVWFNTVIRGDRGKISIGKGCNIQDNAVIHSDESNVEIGDGVTVGHGCILHGGTVKSNALIGMNATVLHEAWIGEYAIIGAGALVPPKHKVPDNTIVFGVPCKQVRKTTEEDLRLIKNTLRNYAELTDQYLEMTR